MAKKCYLKLLIAGTNSAAIAHGVDLDNDTCTYYISSNGSDKSTCGGTTDTACRTLEHVLYLYYNTSCQSERELTITTLTDLTIDKQIMHIYPMLVKSEVLILSDENTTHPCTVFMDGLKLINSSWQLYFVNVNMINCHVAFLTIDGRNSTNVTIENSIFGYWTFEQVQKVKIKNCSNSIIKDHSTSLNFWRSSGVIENITFKNLNFTGILDGVIIQFNSHIEIRNSYFMNNTVINELIKVASSGTLIMSDCIIKRNKVTGLTGTILVVESEVHLRNTSFSDNNALKGGTAVFMRDHSSLTMQSCIFKNNQVPLGNVIEITSRRGYGGAIYLANKSHAEIYHVNFTQNTAYIGGAIYVVDNSEFEGQYLNFTQNRATSGSAIYAQSSHVSCKNSFLDQNIIDNNETGAAAIRIRNYSTLNLTGIECKRQVGNLLSCIFASDYCNVSVYDSKFAMNRGSAIGIWNHISLVMTTSLFFKNAAPAQGGSIYSHNSTLDISHSTFCHNEAQSGGALFLQLSRAMLNNCAFHNNSNIAVALDNSNVLTENCTFHNNSSPLNGGALYVQEHSTLNLSNTTFLYNSAASGGAVSADSYSVLRICNCSFSNNIALNNGGGLLLMVNATANIVNTTFTENEANDGGAILARSLCQIEIMNSSLTLNTWSAISLVNDNVLKVIGCSFWNNSRAINGGSHCKINVTDTNFIQNKAAVGGSLYIYMATSVFLHNCTFTDNVASSKGGAIAVVNSNINVSACTFTENAALIGGGVFYISGILFVKDSVMTNNSVSGDGGIAYLEVNSNVNIINSIFTTNVAISRGGVLWIRKGIAKVWNSSFVQNRAEISGGVIDAQHSEINISRTVFDGNNVTNDKGGVIYGRMNTRIFASNSRIKHNSALNCGAIAIDVDSVLEISSSEVEHNSGSHMAGIFCAFNASLFIFKNSLFQENKQHIGPSLIVIDSIGYLEDCTFVENQGPIILLMAELRVSNKTFAQNVALESTDIESRTEVNNKLYTYRSLFEHNNITLESNSTNFKQIAIMERFLQETSNNLAAEETQFASIVPQQCLHNCTCHRSPWDRVNIFDCRNKGLKSLPETVLKDTDWLFMSGNNLRSLNEAPDYLENITSLNFSSSNISYVDKKVMKVVIKSAKHLDFSRNYLRTLPQTIKNVNGATKLWISDNPYECNCDIMWMKDWLVDTPSVQDKENVICSTGKAKGVPIYKLDAASLGCGFPLWKIIIISVGSAMVIVVTVILNRKWTAIKFHFYAHFTNDDDSQDLSIMKYDAFVSYSQADEDFVETDVINYLEEGGFKVCWHQRDFMPGTNIAENIADATEHSRRMIFVISRAYVESEWCMKEFREAHAHATGNARNKFLIPILFEDVSIGDLDTDLKFYLGNHTYIKCNNLEMMKKRLRKVMPHIPLLELRPELCEQEESIDVQANTETIENHEVVNSDGDDEANVIENADTRSAIGMIKSIHTRFQRLTSWTRKCTRKDEIPLIEM